MVFLRYGKIRIHTLFGIPFRAHAELELGVPRGRRCQHTLAKFGLAPHPWQLDIYHSTLDILFAKFQIANTQHSISNFQFFGQRVFLVQILLSHCHASRPAHRSRWNATLHSDDATRRDRPVVGFCSSEGLNW